MISFINLCFRPLSGIMFSICMCVFIRVMFFSFRPLSGIMFSILNLTTLWRRCAMKFPSPLGDYVFNLDSLGSPYDEDALFPSPLGDYVFNLHKASNNRLLICLFPSPLGDYVFNLRTPDKYYFKDKFPSPLGDYVFNPIIWICWQ